MFKYIPTPTGLRVHESDAFIKMILGPYGSGKSCMVANDLLFYALSQAPAPDGVRYTHIGVIRSTSGEVLSTSRRSLLEVWPDEFGGIRAGGYPTYGFYTGPVGDGPYDYISQGRPWEPGLGTYINVQFSLYGLETAEDAEKIKSVNWSFAWINEATNIDFSIIAMASGRVGRYPSAAQGGCSYAGLIMDFNQPTPGHYLHNMMQNPERIGRDLGLAEGKTIQVFVQPPAAFKQEDELGKVSYRTNPDAENLENLKDGEGYYKKQIALQLMDGRTDLIDSLYCLLSVPIREGKPVWPEFRRELHLAPTDIEPMQFNNTIIGFDASGIHPAVAVLQEHAGRWAVVDELYGEDMGLEEFIEQALIPLVLAKYSTGECIVSLDPSDPRNAFNALTPSAILKEKGFRVYKPASNSPKLRIQSVARLLNKNVGGLLISPHCELVTAAVQGGYRYPKLRIHGSIESLYNINPVKDKHSHIADALQYACMYINSGTLHESEDTDFVKKKLSRRRKVLGRLI